MFTAHARIALSAAILLTTPHFASARTIDPVTLSVSVSGTGPAAEQEVVETVRSIVGNAFVRGDVESILTLGYGIEGGFLLCLKKSPFAPTGALSDVAQEINRVPRDFRRTDVFVELAAPCFPE